jgi:hypothetical protein
LPYILSIVVERTNCHDLDGIENIPEVMRPVPSQKPKVLIKLNEPAEELRTELCELMNQIIFSCDSAQLRDHLDDVTNILRALVMDPRYLRSFKIQRIGLKIRLPANISILPQQQRDSAAFH